MHQRVEVRRGYRHAPLASDPVGAVLVGEEEEDVGARALRSAARRRDDPEHARSPAAAAAPRPADARRGEWRHASQPGHPERFQRVDRLLAAGPVAPIGGPPAEERERDLVRRDVGDHEPVLLDAAELLLGAEHRRRGAERAAPPAEGQPPQVPSGPTSAVRTGFFEKSCSPLRSIVASAIEWRSPFRNSGTRFIADAAASSRSCWRSQPSCQKSLAFAGRQPLILAEHVGVPLAPLARGVPDRNRRDLHQVARIAPTPCAREARLRPRRAPACPARPFKVWWRRQS